MNYNFESSEYYDNLGDSKYYNFRYWDGFNIFGNNIVNDKHLGWNYYGNTITAEFNEAHPLTVTNNLEGGSGGSYEVEWTETNETTELSSDEVYYAFDNSDNDDRYKIKPKEQSFPALNTTWYFQNWSDGTTTLEREEAITSTNKDFTANYKGINRTASDQAYASNSQRTFETLPNGTNIHV